MSGNGVEGGNDSGGHGKNDRGGSIVRRESQSLGGHENGREEGNVSQGSRSQRPNVGTRVSSLRRLPCVSVIRVRHLESIGRR